jgi:uncharacterized membrane protein (UPF0136 family)
MGLPTGWKNGNVHAMKWTIDRWIILYGFFLIAIGLAGYLSNPEKARTALISGGTFGGLSILWGILLSLKMRWPLTAAMITTIFLVVIFTWRAAVGWMAVLGGDETKLVAAVLISLMWIASVALLPALFGARKRPASIPDTP